MTKPAIVVENLSKRYNIGRLQQRHDTLRDALVDSFKRVSDKTPRLSEPETIWALKDVSFEVQPGEVLGIIGRNGAGKSTLLKILSRITEPTSGRAVITGRVGSLLEVGTGFHPELTGRENIFLNGAILGMHSAEIERKFDEIVAFAEIEKFLDTPVKRYSSGMYVRLAFAVAAHLEPEILLVDEVLSVGDIAFQRKSLNKMGDLASGGRTVLYVSHHMASIQGLCNRCLLVKNGHLVYDDVPLKTISEFNSDIYEQIDSRSLLATGNRRGSEIVRFASFYVTDVQGNKLPVIMSGQDVYFVFEYLSEEVRTIRNLSIGFSLHSQHMQTVFGIYNDYTNSIFTEAPNKGTIRYLIKEFPVTPGSYLVHARMVANGIEADWPLDGIGKINVESGDFYRTGSLGFRDSNSVFYIDGEWSINEEYSTI